MYMYTSSTCLHPSCRCCSENHDLDYDHRSRDGGVRRRHEALWNLICMTLEAVHVIGYILVIINYACLWPRNRKDIKPKETSYFYIIYTIVILYIYAEYIYTYYVSLLVLAWSCYVFVVLLWSMLHRGMPQMPACSNNQLAQQPNKHAARPSYEMFTHIALKQH